MTARCDKMPQMQSSPLLTQLGMLRHQICRSVDLRIASEPKRKLWEPLLSLILLQCCGDAGGILCGHYSGVKFVNLSDKIVPVNSFWLVVIFHKYCIYYSTILPVSLNLIWYVVRTFLLSYSSKSYHTGFVWWLGRNSGKLYDFDGCADRAYSTQAFHHLPHFLVPITYVY